MTADGALGAAVPCLLALDPNALLPSSSMANWQIASPDLACTSLEDTGYQMGRAFAHASMGGSPTVIDGAERMHFTD